MSEIAAAVEALVAAIAASPEDQRMGAIQYAREKLHGLSKPGEWSPVDFVQWVPIDDVCPNDYNPNSVAPEEMQLLRISIAEDGYTQPVVAIWDGDRQKYVIVDGFHRYYTMLTTPEFREKTGDRLPVVVIRKDIKQRMASTVRHNRARGEHAVTGMASMVYSMLDQGWSDAEICNQIGLKPDELVRLKHVTGFSALFADVDYRKSWVTDRMVAIRADWLKKSKQPPQTPAS